MTLGVEGPLSGAPLALRSALESTILTCVGSDGAENWTELLISLETLLVVGREPPDDCDDNYVRKYAGPVRIQVEGGDEPRKIGEIEVWYVDGSRATDNGLDIVDVCDSMTQAEYEYAAAIYTQGSIDSSIVGEPFHNDVLGIHALALATECQGLGLEARMIRKITDTLGYHCAATVIDPDRVGVAEDDELELTPTKTPSFLALTDL